eukprot:8186679-Alexandrium_andersonii.AAC.1
MVAFVVLVVPVFGRTQTTSNKPPTAHRCTALHNPALFCTAQCPAASCAGGAAVPLREQGVLGARQPPGAGNCRKLHCAK